MATKAQQFRTEIERSGPKQPKRVSRAKPPRLTHNEAHRLDGKSGYALEPVGAHPSRKATRGGANRVKPDSALRITARVKNSSPVSRAQRKSGNPI
jgi:hypothetical protein